MVEEVPFALEFHDAVVRGPAEDRGEDHALVGERAVRVVADGVAELVRVAGGVAEVVLAVVLVHPAGLEEAALVVLDLDRGAVLVQEDDRLRVLAELEHVLGELHHAGRDGGLAVGRVGGAAVLGEVVLVALELAAPDAAEVHVVLVVIVVQDGVVDGIAAADGVRHGLERAGGGVADGDACPEDVGLVLGREVHVVLAVAALHHLVVPELAARPRDILDVQRDAVVHDGGGHRVVALDGEDVVVLHVVLAAEVVVRRGGLPVVGRIDMDLAVEHVHGRVRHVVGGEEVAFLNFFGHSCQ